MDDEQEEEILQSVQSFDLSKLQPVNHTFGKIVGNELMCTQHNAPDCPSLIVSPSVVIEEHDGVLQLVDKAPR